MGSKVLCVLIIATIASSGYGLKEVRLPDLEVNYISDPFLGKAIGIEKDFRDTLVNCHVIFPDGALYEAFPNDRILHPNVSFQAAAPPFTSCVIGFRGVGVEFSGVYELLSLVMHNGDNSLSLTRRRFNVRVSVVESNEVTNNQH